MVKIFARAQADVPGLGVGVEAGVMALRGWGTEPADISPYVAARLNLLTFNIPLRRTSD